MTGFLLDTNVISELTRPIPDPQVLHFLSKETDFWLPAVVLYELEIGVQLLPHGRRREQISNTLAAVLAEYDNRVISLGREEAETTAVLQSNARRSGYTVNLADALIAGTARVHDLCVVTRNVGDFEPLNVSILDPWAQSNGE